MSSVAPQDPVALADREIREVLVRHLLRRRPAPTGVLQELRVHNGNAIADVVSVHKELHCYEIKGESDNISRLVRQSEYYDKAFKRTTLVTTENHLSRALEIAPTHWGVLLCKRGAGRILLKALRGAKPSPNYCGTTALLTLWRSEMLSIGVPDQWKPDKLNRIGLASCIEQTRTSTEVQQEIAKALIGRATTTKSLVT